MGRRPRVFAQGLSYHIVARGNHRQPTFLDAADYEAYLVRLARYAARDTVTLLAYCLMPNHVHLLARVSSTPLGRFMQSVQQSYTQRFNRLYDKVGHLFQGRYKAIVCDRDEYLAVLVRYVHLNPVRAGLVERPEAYPYSSHRAYLAGCVTAQVDPRPVLRSLGGPDAYLRLLEDGVGATATPHQHHPPSRGVAPPAPVTDTPVPGSRPIAPRSQDRPLAEALEHVARWVAADPDVLRGRSRSPATSRARAVAAHILVHGLGYRISDVATALGRDAATISLIVARLRDQGPPEVGTHPWPASADVLTGLPDPTPSTYPHIHNQSKPDPQ
jgi:putative transposase